MPSRRFGFGSRRLASALALVALVMLVMASGCGTGDASPDAPRSGRGGGEPSGGGGEGGTGGEPPDAGDGADVSQGGAGGDAGGGAGGAAGDDASADGGGGACGAGKADCNGAAADGCEVDTSTDVASCGACGHACVAPAHADATCASGVCGFTCKTGFADCDGDAADGCELETWSDPANCGACGHACPSGPDASAICSGGVCFLGCATGRGDCDADPSDGCEADLGIDPANCGACGNVCGTAPCIQGGCECASTTQAAQTLPLALYIMVDQSGSMSDSVSGGGTKWDAVQTAMSSFASDPASAGLLVGMQFFPAASTSGTPCFSNADCSGGLTCVGAFLFIPGRCGSDECTAASYATPKLAMSALPGAASAVAAAFAGQGPTGDTPTVPALAGAIQYAKTWGQQNPKNKVAVVLATDGDPGDLCAPPSTVQGVASVAQAAYNGPPSIPTFVVGVGSSLTALNQIAKAGSGGTTNAFLVDTNGNAVQQLIAALQAIQGKLLGCDYAPPTPGMGAPDWGKVNVQVTLGGAPSLLKKVAGAGACDPNAGGWYYDDPLNPTKITLCPATCSPVQTDPNAQVDIQLGCPTKQ